MKNLLRLFVALFAAAFLFSACEGPMGPSGADGSDGTDGKDANETCKLCHNSTIVDAKVLEYSYSLHNKGNAYTIATMDNCVPCHSHQAFIHVVKNNTPATFTQNPSDPSRYVNNYAVPSSAMGLPNPISCFTCHSSLHTNYAATEFFPLTTTAAVPLTLWGGAKTVNFAKTSSNLCAKCHQPLPVTASSGAVIDYGKLISEPNATFNLAPVSYRTGIHYATQAVTLSGTGGIEFGTGYTNSQHTSTASCADCHMATPNRTSGGHSFIAKNNFNGCNTTGCHSGMSASNPSFTATKTEITALLAQLAGKINALGGTHDILQKDPADGKYHGYIDIYDAGANPTGYWRNPSQGSPALPALTNAQFGAIINFQILVRDGSSGAHNYPYIKKLLENTIAAI